MEFGWSDEEVRYRERLRGYVDERRPGWRQDPRQRHAAPDDKQWVIEFNRGLAERGWLTPHWPVEYGGQGATAWQHVILGEEMWGVGEPRGPQYMNVNWIGPAIMLAGTPEQKSEHLGRISAGEVFWSQGFSEPDSGSDLVSLSTSAVRDGDEYVVNGQKIWTSHCQVADWIIVLVRTDPTAARHKGISILVTPIDAPGIEVRRIPGVVGEGSFHEVFFTDVRVPVANRLGEENRGWDIVRAALQFERVGAPRWERAGLVLDALAERAREQGRLTEPEMARRFGEARAACEAARMLAYSVIDERAKGMAPSPQAYVARVSMVRCERIVGELCLETLGAEVLVGDSFGDENYWAAMTAGVASGTYEVQLNLIAGLVLGLPRK